MSASAIWSPTVTTGLRAVRGGRGCDAQRRYAVRRDIARPEQRLLRGACRGGARASRRVAPTAFRAITTSTMASPGDKLVQGAVAICSLPSAIMLPQLGVG